MASPIPGSTLLERLERQALDAPGEPAFRFGDHTWTRAELWQDAGRFGRHLRARGVGPGDRVLIALPNGPEFFGAFLGAQRAGAIPVPLAPESGPDRIADIADLAEARGAVLTREQARRVGDACAQRLQNRGAQLITPDEASAVAGPAPLPGAGPADLCFIQYTSGSTSNPRGVGVTHANLGANLLSLTAGIGITRDDVLVSWLPLYHDMGLILMALVPFTVGARLVLLPSRLATGQPWLRAIERFRGTVTAAPDFSYRFVCRHLGEDERYDLGSLRVALDAAEPVRAGTIRAFEQRFGLSNVVVPGYGLAEATVGVSTWPAGTPVRVDRQGRVSVGPPFPGVDVRIAPTDVAPPGELGLGEIEVGGAAATGGYVDNAEATARLRTADGFIRTGDLGYLDADGFLTITGRCKEMIKQAGRTIAPPEVDELVDRLGGLRRSAAVGIDRGGPEGEQLCIFAELARGAPEAREPAALVGGIVRAFQAHFGFRPGRVLLLAPRGIPRTANGKVRRSTLAERYLDGSLARDGLLLFPPGDPATARDA